MLCQFMLCFSGGGWFHFPSFAWLSGWGTPARQDGEKQLMPATSIGPGMLPGAPWHSWHFPKIQGTLAQAVPVLRDHKVSSIATTTKRCFCADSSYFLPGEGKVKVKFWELPCQPGSADVAEARARRRRSTGKPHLAHTARTDKEITHFAPNITRSCSGRR